MKLDPGFCNHWKTEKLIAELGAEAVVALLRFWGNAQIKREFSNFALNPRRLALITKWTGDPDALFNSLTDPLAAWIDANPDGTYSIHDFDSHQKQIIHLWESGGKGGRPKKQTKASAPKEEDTNTSSYSSSYPICEPNGNQMVSKSRESELLEVMPTGAAKGMLELEKRIQSIKKEWSPALTYAEQNSLMQNGRAIDSITDEQWDTLRRFMAAKVHQGENYWQPRSRSKFLETISDVLSSAIRWEEKQKPFKPPAQLPPVQPRKVMSKEEIAAMMNSTD